MDKQGKSLSLAFLRNQAKKVNHITWSMEVAAKLFG